MLWKNKILVRAEIPFSSFHHLHLTLLHHHSSISLKLHSLCWKLSRKWRLACFSDSSDIYIIYQKSQSNSVAHVVKELRECLPISDVVADEELNSGSLISKAIDCSLRSVLLENGWSWVGNGCTVNSSFASSEEKSDLYALHVTVQIDIDDGFVFLVSPDMVRFSQLKIMDILGSKAHQRFHGGGRVVLDEYCFKTSCSVLPSLCEGHIIGLSRLLPAEVDFEHMEELWSFKHGLTLPNDYFVHIQFSNEGHVNKHWFPSVFILQGSGLTPAPHTIRASKAIFALESFMTIIEGWDFFDGGLLRIKGACRLGISSDLPVWTKPACSINNHILNVNESSCVPVTVDGKIPFSKGLLSNNDFRTPKPAQGFVCGSETSECIHIQGSTGSASTGSQSDTHACFQDVVSINTTTKFRPLFKGRIPVKRTIQSGHLPKCNAIIEKHDPLIAFKKDNQFNTKEDASLRKDAVIGSVHVNFGTSIYGRKSQVFLNWGALNSLSESRKVHAGEDTEKNTPKKEVKQPFDIAATKEKEKSMPKKQTSRDPGRSNFTAIEDFKQTTPKKRTKQPSDISARGEVREGSLQKKQMKQQIDPSDITAKVIDYHARGQLGSLTVPELKSYLGSRKAQVGGKKEDLIQRIMTMLC